MIENQAETRKEIDPTLLVNTLIDLQVGIRKISFYSSSHTIIPNIIGNLLKQFQNLFQSIDTIQLGITKDEILYLGNPVAKNNPVIRELARMLNQLNLISITFQADLTHDHILCFLNFVAEARSMSLIEKEKALSQYMVKASGILVQHITLGQASPQEHRARSTESTDRGMDQRKDIWRGLINKLSEGSNIPEEVQKRLQAGDENTLNGFEMAKIIHQLSKERKTQSKSYEGEIVKYLNEQANQLETKNENPAEFEKDLGKFLSNLPSEVRERIFKFSIENCTENKTHIENWIDGMPPTLLPEVLKQIQVNDQNISAPIFNLLKKFTKLSGSNEQLKEELGSKLKDNQELFEELFTDRADRTYYPSTYRSMLDEELSAMGEGSENDSSPTENQNWDVQEANRHLAMVLLELLEGPIHTQDQYDGCLNQMVQLLNEGIGDSTQTVLLETIKILIQKHQLEPEENKEFLQKQISKFCNPEMLTHLMNTPQNQTTEDQGTLLTEILNVMGPEMAPALLDLLEAEERLSVRKTLLALIGRSGETVIPCVTSRLKSEKWFVVRNMLVLLKDLKALEAVPQIAGCMDHANAKVRGACLQALETLDMNSDFFFLALEKALVDEDDKVFTIGASFIGAHKNLRILDITVTFLQSSKSSGEGWERKQTLLKTIGKTGGQEWVSVLENLKKSLVIRFWNWGSQRTLQKAISETLAKIDSRSQFLHAMDENHAH